MPFDMTRCPQTEDEARDWFFAGIGQQRGAPATNWEAIMTGCGLPPGYGPGVIPNASMPYFAFTQQFSGVPKGRIFLPSATPDENGYYTRCMQYVDDAAGTYAKSGKSVDANSSGLVWAWYWVAGHAYAPVQSAEGTAPPAGEYQDQIDALHDRVEALEGAYAALEERLTVVEGALAGGLHAHGPINLPIVLESLTSLRCKGDIDVAVKPGQATPPDMTAADPPDAATLILLRRLLGGHEAES